MFDVAIIGCGITGAAAAYQLSMYDLKVVVLEKENDIALGATRANSAIIHAGYDPEPGTLMAKVNVRGCALAKELCEKLDVPYKKTMALSCWRFPRKRMQRLKSCTSAACRTECRDRRY